MSSVRYLLVHWVKSSVVLSSSTCCERLVVCSRLRVEIAMRIRCSAVSVRCALLCAVLARRVCTLHLRTLGCHCRAPHCAASCCAAVCGPRRSLRVAVPRCPRCSPPRSTLCFRCASVLSYRRHSHRSFPLQRSPLSALAAPHSPPHARARTTRSHVQIIIHIHKTGLSVRSTRRAQSTAGGERGARMRASRAMLTPLCSAVCRSPSAQPATSLKCAANQSQHDCHPVSEPCRPHRPRVHPMQPYPPQPPRQPRPLPPLQRPPHPLVSSPRKTTNLRYWLCAKPACSSF